MIKLTAPRLRIPEGPGFNFRPEDQLNLLKYFCGIRYFLKVISALTPQIVPRLLPSAFFPIHYSLMIPSLDPTHA